MRIRRRAYRNTIMLIRSSVLYGTMYRVASICFCIFQRCTSHRTMYMTYYRTYTWIRHDSVKAEYDICDGNSNHSVAEYQQRFPNRRIPTRRVFTRVYQTLRDTGTLPGVRIAAERDVDEEEGIDQMVQSSPRASTRRIARRLRVPHTKVCGEHCMQRARIHTTCSECNISDLAILLRGWNFASGSMAFASCIVTSSLLSAIQSRRCQ